MYEVGLVEHLRPQFPEYQLAGLYLWWTVGATMLRLASENTMT
jgi:hypothetical protein